MIHNSMYQNFFNGLDKNLQAQLSYHFRKQMILEDFAKSKEMQKLKAEITQDVLNSVSINIENKIRQTLDELFKEFNI